MVKAADNWHAIFRTFKPKRRFALQSPAQRPPGKCVTVASQKGGVGKTTTAVNVAAALGLAGFKVLLYDLDPQANATSGVGETQVSGIPGETNDPRHTRSVFLESMGRDTFLISSIRETDFENLWVLPSFRHLSDGGAIQALVSQKIDLWKKQIGHLRRLFDVVLIDCPPSLGGLPTLALSVSDEVIIPVQCEYYAMEGLSQILPVVEELQAGGRRQLKIAGLLLTMFSEDLQLARDVVSEITEYFEDLVYRSIIPRDVTLAESASHGLPVYYYSPDSRAAWSYLDLTREILSHEPA